MRSQSESAIDSPTRPLRTMQGVLGRATCWIRIFEQLERVVETTCPVLLSGPHGSGKHTCARALHAAQTTPGPFVLIDALSSKRNPSEPSERTTPSPRARALEPNRRFPESSDPTRWIEAAQGGTLYVSELTALPSSAQIILEEAVRRQSGPRFRLVAGSRHAAVNLPLHRQVRTDFFYRLSVLSVEVPPLRHRNQDILEMACAFLEEIPTRHGEAWQLSGSTKDLLLSYAWPGNMNELRSAMEHATLVASSASLLPSDLPAGVLSLGQTPPHRVLLPDDGIDLRRTLEEMENELLTQALERTSWNKQHAARLLGLNRTTLVEMLKRKRLNRAGA